MSIGWHIDRTLEDLESENKKVTSRGITISDECVYDRKNDCLKSYVRLTIFALDHLWKCSLRAATQMKIWLLISNRRYLATQPSSKA